MEKESFFTKLRRLGTTVENETARLEENMKKPIGLRSSGKSNRRSSHLVLKEMLHDAQNVKREARQTLNNVKSENHEFQEIVSAVQALCHTNKTQIQEIEDYLQQYGYVPYQQQGEKKSKKGKENDKENVAQDKCGEPKPAPTDGKKEMQSVSETDKETNNFATPPKSSQQSEQTPSDAAGSRTPQLADFGLSQITMDRLAMMKMPQSMRHTAPSTSVQATPAMSDRTYNLSANPSLPRYYPPMTTPLCQQPMPFSQDTLRVTPGLFGNRQVPMETPEHFIDKALPKPGMDDSPIPPIFSTVKKWPKTSHMAPPQMSTLDGQDDVVESSPGLPQPPDLTIAWSEIIPAPPHLQQDPSSSISTTDVTPPMPVFQVSKAVTTMPSAPTRLATKYQFNVMPEEPIQLASQAQHGTEMPSRPVLLAEKFGMSTSMPPEPVQLASQVQGDVGTPPEPVLLTQRFGARHYIPSQLSQPSSIPQTTANLNANSHMATPQQPTYMMTAFNNQYPNTMATSTMTTGQITMPPNQNSMVISQNAMPGGGLGVGVTPQKPVSLMRLQEAEDDMPRTPVLSMAYKRFVDIQPPAMTEPSASNPGPNSPPATPVMKVAPYQALPSAHTGYQQAQGEHGQGAGGPALGKRSGHIAAITPQEFSGVQDYLQRILPLHVINGHIDTLNQMLQCKQDPNFITEEETKIVDLGAQLKVMLLLLCKLKRWEKGKSPQTNETVYFIM